MPHISIWCTTSQPNFISALYNLLVLTPSKLADILTRNLMFAFDGKFDQLMDKMIEAENLEIEYGNEIQVWKEVI